MLIVNHALLLSDVATGNRVLPEYQTLIVDEAHHLEDATTNALSYRVTQWDVDRLLRELGGPRGGALGWLLAAAQEVLRPDEFVVVEQSAHHAADLAFQFEHLTRQFFSALEQFLAEQREGRQVGAYSQQERILPATRTLPSWADVEAAWDEAEHTLSPMLELLAKLLQGLSEILPSLPEGDEELFSTLSNLYHRFTELHNNLEAIVFKPDHERI